MYRLAGRKRLRRGDEIIEPGETFAPTEAELNAFPDKLEKVEDDTQTPDETTQETSLDICGEEMTDGSLCERPAGECPYH